MERRLQESQDKLNQRDQALEEENTNGDTNGATGGNSSGNVVEEAVISTPPIDTTTPQGM